MKYSANSENNYSPKSNTTSKTIVKCKTKCSKISKLVVRDKKNIEEAKNRLKEIREGSNSFGSSGEPLKELSLADIMHTINELIVKSDGTTDCSKECSTRMISQFDTFWTSPRAILKSIKHCILRRNWEKITYLLLLLLQHKDQYVPIVHKLCIFISKFNPMVQILGLQEEFEVLKERKK